MFVGCVLLLPNAALVRFEKRLQLRQHHLEHRETQTQFLAREQRERFGDLQLLLTTQNESSYNHVIIALFLKTLGVPFSVKTLIR